MHLEGGELVFPWCFKVWRPSFLLCPASSCPGFTGAFRGGGRSRLCRAGSRPPIDVRPSAQAVHGERIPFQHMRLQQRGSPVQEDEPRCSPPRARGDRGEVGGESKRQSRSCETSGERRRRPHDPGPRKGLFRGTQKPHAMKEKHQTAFRQKKNVCLSEDSHADERAGHKLGKASCRTFIHKRTRFWNRERILTAHGSELQPTNLKSHFLQRMQMDNIHVRRCPMARDVPRAAPRRSCPTPAGTAGFKETEGAKCWGEGRAAEWHTRRGGRCEGATALGGSLAASPKATLTPLSEPPIWRLVFGQER